MTQPLNIAVCGCGPAGLAAALLLHRRGHHVCIVERFEAPRALGSGLILQPTGLSVLAELGVLDQIMAQGARIDRLFGRVVPSNRVVLDVRYSAIGPHWHGIAVHRATLFDALHKQVMSAGIPVETKNAVTHVVHRGTHALVQLEDGRRLGPFDLVIDALGTRSPLSNAHARRSELEYGAVWANVPWPNDSEFVSNALEQRYRRASHMAGLLPIGRGLARAGSEAAFFWSLRRSDVDTWRRQPLVRWKDEVERLWPQAAATLDCLVDHDQLTFAHYSHFTLQRPYEDRVVHIGDSAHSTSPQLGQGANMALLDALALARALDRHPQVEQALPAYARMRRWHIRLFQAASALFTPFYQSDSRVLPWLRDRVAAPVSRLPIGDAILARLVSGMTISPLRGMSFLPWHPQR